MHRGTNRGASSGPLSDGQSVGDKAVGPQRLGRGAVLATYGGQL